MHFEKFGVIIRIQRFFSQNGGGPWQMKALSWSYFRLQIKTVMSSPNHIHHHMEYFFWTAIHIHHHIILDFLVFSGEGVVG
jgi:hypothetical protein